MSRLARIYRIQQWLLAPGSAVTFADMLGRLEVSSATLKRDLAYLGDQLNVPVEFDRMAGGYVICHQHAGDRAELPGLWFLAQEMQALLTMHKLLADLDAGGLLAPHVESVVARIRTLLARDGAATEQVLQRIQLHLPYLTPQELVTEVLSWGAAVRVLSPPDLIEQDDYQRDSHRHAQYFEAREDFVF